MGMRSEMEMEMEMEEAASEAAGQWRGRGLEIQSMDLYVGKDSFMMDGILLFNKKPETAPASPGPASDLDVFHGRSRIQCFASSCRPREPHRTRFRAKSRSADREPRCGKPLVQRRANPCGYSAPYDAMLPLWSSTQQRDPCRGVMDCQHQLGMMTPADREPGCGNVQRCSYPCGYSASHAMPPLWSSTQQRDPCRGVMDCRRSGQKFQLQLGMMTPSLQPDEVLDIIPWMNIPCLEYIEPQMVGDRIFVDLDGPQIMQGLSWKKESPPQDTLSANMLQYNVEVNLNGKVSPSKILQAKRKQRTSSSFVESMETPPAFVHAWEQQYKAVKALGVAIDSPNGELLPLYNNVQATSSPYINLPGKQNVSIGDNAFAMTPQYNAAESLDD